MLDADVKFYGFLKLAFSRFRRQPSLPGALLNLQYDLPKKILKYISAVMPRCNFYRFVKMAFSRFRSPDVGCFPPSLRLSSQYD